MKVLMSAYAFRPDMGSEPGIGWHWAAQAARDHDVWVITAEANRPAVEQELSARPIPSLHVRFHDLIGWAHGLASIGRPAHIHTYRHMYLWHITARAVAKRLHADVGFDVAHHVTYGSIRNWSYLAGLGIPFAWGPVGGGEQPDLRLLRSLPLRVQVKEVVRNCSNALVAYDPLVRWTARSADMVLATTWDSARRLPGTVAHKIHVVQNIGLDQSEIDFALRTRRSDEVRLLFVGRLLPWKGVDLAIEAITRLVSRAPNLTLTIIGDGPDKERLASIAARLNLMDHIRFLGSVPRNETLKLLPEYDIFIFPSLHDSGGFAVLEAMAARLPVICLDIGGPAVTVSEACGFRICAKDRPSAVHAIAGAISLLASDPCLRATMGEAGRRRILGDYVWDEKLPVINSLYAQLTSQQP